jgi:cytochrome c oxidase assembly factor CtaG
VEAAQQQQQLLTFALQLAVPLKVMPVRSSLLSLLLQQLPPWVRPMVSSRSLSCHALSLQQQMGGMLKVRQVQLQVAVMPAGKMLTQQQQQQQQQQRQNTSVHVTLKRVSSS